MISPVKTAIVGASGYSGEELVRLLLRHPHTELAAVTSRQYAGQAIGRIFPRHAGDPRAGGLQFSEPDIAMLAKAAQVVFLALPHGVAAEFAGPLVEAGGKVIDLSADFRLKSPAIYKEFYGKDHAAPALLQKSVYGLPEFYRAEIKTATLIASPGCYPTSILLPLLPLLKAGLIKSSGIIADSMSGVSGAGRKVDAEYLFAECNESVRPYGIPKHRHLSEIEEQLSLAGNQPVILQFTPHLIPVNRGILTTLYIEPTGNSTSNEAVAACYQKVYGHEPFVRILEDDRLPDTKNVTGTNMIEIGWRIDPRTGRLIIISAIDNIVKGASGQAVQSMNILCGFPETAGLI